MENNLNILIRKANIKDVNDIFNIQVASYSICYHETIATLSGKLAKTNAICYMAYFNNKVAGYLLSYPEEDNYTSLLHEEATLSSNNKEKNYTTWYLHDLAIHPNFSGLNIAKKLYQTALLEAKNLKLTKSKLVAVQNAATFWTKLGYQEIGKPSLVAGYLKEAIIMEKSI
jgi:ribosomal protein S18 acetylase RimI-like enzyme